MIDWIKAELPFNWTVPIVGGHLIRISPVGVVERQTPMSAHVRGSYDEHLTLRTVARGVLEVDGNPSKFLQGHNIVGSDDLCGLMDAAVCKALAILGHTPADDDRAQWLAGEWNISRIDLTQMYELDTVSDVRAWLRSAGELARMRWRGRGTFEGTTLYFGKVAKGKRAADWTLKCYCKADEVQARGKSHQLPDRLPLRDALMAWVEYKLRVELLMRTGELKRFEGGQYRRASAWNIETASVIFGQYFAKMELGENVMLPVEIEETLKPAMRLAYNSWKAGNDLRGLLPRRTFYHYRRNILALTDGLIDIAVPQPKTNVIPLRRILTLRPASDPTFLADRSDLLFRRAA
jgi:II/X family phage/plasmid replication protein